MSWVIQRSDGMYYQRTDGPELQEVWTSELSEAMVFAWDEVDDLREGERLVEVEEGVFLASALPISAMQREAGECSASKGFHVDDHQPLKAVVREIAVEGLGLLELCANIEALRKGAEHAQYEGVCISGADDKQVRTLSWLALVATEVGEAMEDVIAGRWTTTMREDGKPEGLGSEIADIVIRCGDICAQLGIDLEREVREKQVYNRTRPHMNGGKKA